MADPPLDPRELEAIQEAIREARVVPERSQIAATVDPEEVSPLALIADDRAAENARPSGMRIAERWTAIARRRMRLFVPGEIEVNVVNAETVDGASLRDELAGMWICSVSANDRTGAGLIACGGPMIEHLAARLLGAAEDDEEEEDTRQDRIPSFTAVSVFAPVGEAVADALVLAWQEEQGCECERHSEAYESMATKRLLTETDVVIGITLSVTGALEGRIRLFAKPGTLVRPPASIDAVPAAVGAIEEALGNVPIEVEVEFGRAQLSMRQVGNLEVGTIVPLQQFVDDVLAVECAGVVKVYGRPVVYRGVLAIEVVQFAQPALLRGSKAA